MDCSVSKEGPSTLGTHIVDGPMPNTGTFHDNASNHGRSDIQTGTFHVRGRNHGWYHPSRPNLPRWRPKSWMVRCPERDLRRWLPKILDSPGISSGKFRRQKQQPAGKRAFPEPGAVLTVCSRRRRFIPAAVPSLALAEN